MQIYGKFEGFSRGKKLCMKFGSIIHHDHWSCRSLQGVKYDDRTTAMDLWLIGSFADALSPGIFFK